MFTYMFANYDREVLQSQCYAMLCCAVLCYAMLCYGTVEYGRIQYGAYSILQGMVGYGMVQ